MSQFWHVDLGNVLAAGSLLLAFWAANRAIVTRIQQSADRMARIEERLNLVYDWFLATWGGSRVPPEQYRSGGGSSAE